MAHPDYIPPVLTKTELARQLGVSRSSLYYHHKRPMVDEEIKRQIESVLTDYPSYGHKRIALKLRLNKKRIRRVMKKFGMKPYRRRVRSPRKPQDRGKPPVDVINITKILCPVAPCIVYVSDFTYIRYQERFIYLATVMDMYTREVIGWNISRYHNKELVIGALLDAVKRQDGKTPLYIHSDQGSEYDAEDYMVMASSYGITISMSSKHSPWQNAFQESFYSHFKVDLGDPERFETLPELIEAVHHQIVEYNTDRIHTSLKMTPELFRLRWIQQQKTLESLFRKRGT